MHNASTYKKSKDVAVRVSRKSWDTLGEFTKETKLKKKQQFDVLIEEEENRKRKLNGVRSQ